MLKLASFNPLHFHALVQKAMHAMYVALLCMCVCVCARVCARVCVHRVSSRGNHLGGGGGGGGLQEMGVALSIQLFQIFWGKLPPTPPPWMKPWCVCVCMCGGGGGGWRMHAYAGCFPIVWKTPLAQVKIYAYHNHNGYH